MRPAAIVPGTDQAKFEEVQARDGWRSCATAIGDAAVKGENACLVVGGHDRSRSAPEARGTMWMRRPEPKRWARLACEGAPRPPLKVGRSDGDRRGAMSISGRWR